MADNLLNTSIAAIKTKILSDVTSANAEDVSKLARMAKSVGLEEDSQIETALNTRVESLTTSATVEELSKLAQAIKQVKGSTTLPASTDSLSEGSSNLYYTNARVDARISASGASGTVNQTVSDTQPSSPSAGDLWFDSSDGSLSVYYSDGTSSQWVAVSGPAGPQGQQGNDGSSGSSVTTYANLAAFPSSGNTVGDFGFDQATGGLYNWSGSAWKRIYSGVDESPTWTTEPPATANLSTDGTATNQTVAATDPEGFPITYSYDTNPSNQTQTTITNTGGDFTITPSTDLANNGSFTLRYKATDGIHVTTRSTTYTLSINPAQSWTAVYGPITGLSVTNTRNALALSSSKNFNSNTTHSFRYWKIEPFHFKGGNSQGDMQMASIQFQLNGANVSWPGTAQVLNVYNILAGDANYGQPMSNTMAAYNNPQSLVDNDGSNTGGKHYFGGLQSVFDGTYFKLAIIIDAGSQITANQFNYWTGNDVTDRDPTGFWVYGSNISGDLE